MNAIGGVQVFQRVGTLDQIELDTPTSVQLNGRSICFVRLKDEVIAFEDRCPHRGHPLSKGKCHDGVLQCALHGWEFSMPEGQAVSPRAPFGLELLDCRVVDGHLEVAS